MDNRKCKNCGYEFEGEKCPKCGYSINVMDPFKNVISDRTIKENLGDTAISLLINAGFMTMSKKDLDHLVIEFGYLLYSEKNDMLHALLKVTTKKRMFSSQKNFYLGTQDGKLILLNEKFDDSAFRKISSDMLFMHKIDLNLENKNQYFMELH